MNKNEISFNFDLERMKKAIAGPSITIPPGLSREEMRWFILNCSVGDKKGLFSVPEELRNPTSDTDLKALSEFAKRMYEDYKE